MVPMNTSPGMAQSPPMAPPTLTGSIQTEGFPAHGTEGFHAAGLRDFFSGLGWPPNVPFHPMQQTMGPNFDGANAAGNMNLYYGAEAPEDELGGMQ